MILGKIKYFSIYDANDNIILWTFQFEEHFF